MKVLCIDDAPDILEVLGLSLQMRWPDVDVLKAADGPTALALFRNESPELLIVDLDLPNLDGYEVIGRIRASSKVPIIMLTEAYWEPDIVIGLELGADGYIAEPFSDLELSARVQAVVRRASNGVGSKEQIVGVGQVKPS